MRSTSTTIVASIGALRSCARPGVRPSLRGRSRRAPALILALVIAAAACSGDRPGDEAGDQPSSAASVPARVPNSASADQVAESLVVYKSPTCECCQRWVDHMRDSDFRVVVYDVDDLTPVKPEHGITEALGSCHPALVGG